jgi:hypothetical protein
MPATGVLLLKRYNLDVDSESLAVNSIFVDIFVVSFVALLRSSQNSTKAFLRNYERWGG